MHSISDPSVAGPLLVAGPAPDVVVGRLVGLDSTGAPTVEYPGNPGLTAQRARTCVALAERDIGGEVVLCFDRFGRFPIVMGRILDPSRETGPTARPSVSALRAQDAGAGELVLAAHRGLTLRCGAASLTLTPEGVARLSGTTVETLASGTNRIRGGAVRIN